MITTPAAPLAQSANVSHRVIAGRMVLMKAPVIALYVLNDVGGFIWQLLADSRTQADICRAVVDRFDVDADRAEQDVGAFLAHLAREGLIRAA